MRDQRREVVRISRGIRSAFEWRRGRKAAMRERHAGEARREMRDLLKPREMIAAKAVRKDERGSFARDLIVDLAIRPLQRAQAVVQLHDDSRPKRMAGSSSNTG